MTKAKRAPGDRRAADPGEAAVLVFRRNEDREWPVPGEWRAVRDRERRRGAVICCPGCRQIYSVGLTIGHHRIAQDGTVAPTVGCLTDGCGFHEFISLESWIPQ